MEALIPSPAACEVRSVTKFFNVQSIAPIEIHRQLCQVYGPNIMSKQMVRRWCRQFSEGRQSVHDEERSGRPYLINDDRVELMRQCIKENRRFTITELSSHFRQISRSLLHEIVTKHLLFKKVCARWLPKNLTPEHKMQRFGAALTFLQRYHDHGDEFLDRIVTGDKTWISHFTPETKQQSIHWRHSRSPVRMKFKQTLSVRKVMCTVFWDRKGILLNDFLPRGVVLLHDNARPHTARRTAAVLTEFGWELFDHPPYSPDLAPSDFHVFLHLKKFLSSEIFTVLSGNYTVIATDNLSYLILGACLESFENVIKGLNEMKVIMPGEMSPGSSTESYPAFARIGLRENPGKNLNKVTCPDRDSNPGHLVSRPDALTVTPQVWTLLKMVYRYRSIISTFTYFLMFTNQLTSYTSGRQHSLKCEKGKRSHPVCTVVQQEKVESIPASSHECTMVHCVFRGIAPFLNMKRESLSQEVKNLLNEHEIQRHPKEEHEEKEEEEEKGQKEVGEMYHDAEEVEDSKFEKDTNEKTAKDKQVVVITEDVQNVHLLLKYRPHINVSLTCEHDPKLQEYCVCPQNMPQFDSEGIPNQAPETNKPMILNGPTSRNREGSDQVSVEAKQLGHLNLTIDQETFDPSTGELYD
ncbi:hypothetical protein ANN_26757 [Periplaneta americana]|uniref:Mos1 transposase HTH domain-containing protein n=1 Tax=Periplaneta americana TaxID=6978 RepID=A0ABQ8RYY0_PERAM|nr:hypothetical protein ANN_26757 [Periplaneta americana]